MKKAFQIAVGVGIGISLGSVGSLLSIGSFATLVSGTDVNLDEPLYTYDKRTEECFYQTRHVAIIRPSAEIHLIQCTDKIIAVAKTQNPTTSPIRVTTSDITINVTIINTSLTDQQVVDNVNKSIKEYFITPFRDLQRRDKSSNRGTIYKAIII